MERAHPTPRTRRRLLLATLVATLALPALSAAALPPSDPLGPSASSAASATPVDAPATEGTLDVRQDLDLDALPFLDAAGEYDPAGDATITVDPLTPEPVVMGEEHGHEGDHDHGIEAQSSEEQEGGAHAHDDAGDTAASAGGGSLPSARRPLACTPSGAYRTVVLYAHLRGQPQARSQHLGTIRQTMERSNQMLAQSARASGGPLADLRAACTSGGAVSVATAEVTSRDFGDIKRQLASQGFDQRHEKYLVFADFAHTNSGIAGLADLFHDTRRSVHNHNNGNHAMYAIVYGSRHFTGPTAMHELTHSMGAAQRGAPGADDGGHCTSSGDLLCVGGASSVVLDRGNDTYFSTNTRSGQWLHHHWNIGWEGNRFVHVHGRSTYPVPEGSSFADTAGSTHEDAIERAAAAGIISGYADATFRPSQPVTRAQLATMMSRVEQLSPRAPAPFSDVAGTTHEGAIGAAARAGIVGGFANGTFLPDGNLTRAQAASVLTRAHGIGPRTPAPFSDVAGSTHEGAIGAGAHRGIVSGHADGTFRPSQPVTRGQVASLIDRSYDLD